MKYLVLRIAKTKENKFGSIEIMAMHPEKSTAMDTVRHYQKEFEEFKKANNHLKLMLHGHLPEYRYAIVEVNDYEIF